MGSAEAIWGVDNGRFAASMGTVGRGCRVWCSHHHYCTSVGVVGEGAQGFWLGARGGGRKIVHNVGVDRDTAGLTLIFDVGCLMPYFSVKKYGGGMMLVCY